MPVRPAGGRRALGRRTYGLGWVNSDGRRHACPPVLAVHCCQEFVRQLRPRTAGPHRTRPRSVRQTRPGRVVHPDGRGLGALARSLLTAIPRCTARRAMAAARPPHGPRGQRRSPPEGPAPLAWRACAQQARAQGSKCGRCYPAPAPPAVPCPRSPRRSPTGGALAASDGLVGFVCPTEFWGHVTREIFKIRPKSQL